MVQVAGFASRFQCETPLQTACGHLYFTSELVKKNTFLDYSSQNSPAKLASWGLESVIGEGRERKKGGKTLLQDFHYIAGYKKGYHSRPSSAHFLNSSRSFFQKPLSETSS